MNILRTNLNKKSKTVYDQDSYKINRTIKLIERKIKKL